MVVHSGLGVDSPVTMLAGLGPAKIKRLERLGITTISDLLLHLPRRYQDTRNVVALADVRPGDTVTVRVHVTHALRRRSAKKAMVLVEATLRDGGATASAIWFNQPYLLPQLEAGTELLVSGKVDASPMGLQFRSPKFERVGATQQHVGRLAPIYPETDGLTSRYLRTLIEPLLPLAAELPDVLPMAVRESQALMTMADAVRLIHAPIDPDDADRARQRIAFEELFMLQLAAERARRRRLSGKGVVIAYDVEAARRFTEALPFRLTDGQRQAAHRILTDMADSGPMNRLLQGDVGSGKTAVAAMAAVMTHEAGYQTAVMAPTEILARQHYMTLQQLLEPHGMAPRLLMGSTTDRARREILDGFAGGNETVLVGTHALIEDDVLLPNLGLVVVDEQHRFGVAQRQRLRLKTGEMPNFLAMTATPIPRSLALTLYGDVNVSEIREMPPGRRVVKTSVVPPFERDAAYSFIREQVGEGRQVFVICPLVEISDKLGVKSAVAEHARLQSDVFPDLQVELLHGRMPAKEKAARMGRFATGEANILVATSVVEVGVDVPNATVMVIEAAERFGLAQLHQFRGRVGRGGHQSFCLLFQGSVEDEVGKRLQAVASTPSGFDLAELDLRMRGPGDVAGLRQHGLPEMRAADLLDVVLAQRARAAASDWLDQDPELVTHPPLRDAMMTYRAVFDLD